MHDTGLADNDCVLPNNPPDFLIFTIHASDFKTNRWFILRFCFKIRPSGPYATYRYRACFVSERVIEVEETPQPFLEGCFKKARSLVKLLYAQLQVNLLSTMLKEMTSSSCTLLLPIKRVTRLLYPRLQQFLPFI